jgi:hypothetical protein
MMMVLTRLAHEDVGLTGSARREGSASVRARPPDRERAAYRVAVAANDGAFVVVRILKLVKGGFARSGGHREGKGGEGREAREEVEVG